MTLKQILGFAVGPIGGALLAFISLPVVTWFFKQEDIGRLSMMQVIVSFSLLFLTLGLDQAYVREYHESDNKSKILFNTFVPGYLLLAVITAIAIFYLEEISHLLFVSLDTSLSVLVVICVHVSYISRYLSLLLRMQERGLAYSMSQILPKVFFLALVGAYLLFDVDFTTLQLLVAHTFSTIVVLLVYGWNTRIDWLSAIQQKIEPPLIGFMLGYSFPLILGGLAYWGLTAMDKIFIRWLADLEELGIYSVAVSFAGAAVIFQSIFTTVWAPIVYKLVSSGGNLDKIQEVNRYVLFAVLLLFCGAGLFSWVIDYILPINYSQVKYFFVACLGFPLLYTLSETTAVGVGVTRRTMFALTASFLAFVLNAGLNYLLIPKYGAAGAAVSTCISFWFFLILRTEFSIYVWRPMPRTLLYSCTFIAVSGAVLYCFYGMKYKYEFIVFWFLFLLSSIYVFRSEVKKALLYFRGI